MQASALLQKKDDSGSGSSQNDVVDTAAPQQVGGGGGAPAQGVQALRQVDMSVYMHKLMPFKYNNKDNTVSVCLPLKGNLEPLYRLNDSLLVACDSNADAIRAAINRYFKDHPQDKKRVAVHKTRYYGNRALVDDIVRVIRSGKLCSAGYDLEIDTCTVYAEIQRHRIQFCKDLFDATKLLAHQPIKEVSARDGRKRGTKRTKRQDDECSSEIKPAPTTALVRFWKAVDRTHTAEYEGAIESFFVHPHIAAVYARMEACELDWKTEELATMCEACAEGASPTGYVYAAWNSLFGHLLKIGATMFTPQKRLRELSSTGVPEPFELVACIKSANPFALEKAIHRHFSNVRTYGRRKEFFTLTREQSIVYFKSIGGYAACAASELSAEGA